MKTGKDHRVPLSKRAIRLLTDLPIIDSNPFVFPSARNRSLSDTALTGVLKRLDRKNVTVHGFRSSFRDWAAECTSFSRDVAEMALAHSISNSVEAAYRRGDLYLKRQLLMAEWADYCDKVQEQPAKVLSIQRNAINAN
jgi:integrase